MLIQMVKQIKMNRIQNLQRERLQVDWLFQANTKLAKFIKEQQFCEINFWRFEDEHKNLHMDISEGDEETDFWIQKWKEKMQERDEFFKCFKELLPPSRLKKNKKERIVPE